MVFNYQQNDAIWLGWVIMQNGKVLILMFVLFIGNFCLFGPNLLCCSQNEVRIKKVNRATIESLDLNLRRQMMLANQPPALFSILIRHATDTARRWTRSKNHWRRRPSNPVTTLYSTLFVSTPEKNIWTSTFVPLAMKVGLFAILGKHVIVHCKVVNSQLFFCFTSWVRSQGQPSGAPRLN